MDKADRRREALYDETDIGEITVRRSRKSIKAEGAACVQEAVTARSAEKEPAEQNQDEAVGFSIRRADTKRRENAKEQKQRFLKAAHKGSGLILNSNRRLLNSNRRLLNGSRRLLHGSRRRTAACRLAFVKRSRRKKKAFTKAARRIYVRRKVKSSR